MRLIQEIVEQDRCVSIRQIASGIDIASSTVHSILHNNLYLRSLCAKWIPKELSDEQKTARVNSAQELTVLFENHDPQKIIYVDEKWFYHRTLGSKVTNRSWCASASDKNKVARISQSDSKSHVIIAATFGGEYLLRDYASTSKHKWTSLHRISPTNAPKVFTLFQQHWMEEFRPGAR